MPFLQKLSKGNYKVFSNSTQLLLLWTQPQNIEANHKTFLKSLQLHYKTFEKLIFEKKRNLLPSTGVLIWVTAFIIIGDSALPGGQLFDLVVLTVAANFGGWLISLTTLPRLIGMLLIGLLFQVNILYSSSNRLSILWFLSVIFMFFMAVSNNAGLFCPWYSAMALLKIIGWDCFYGCNYMTGCCRVCAGIRGLVAEWKEIPWNLIWNEITKGRNGVFYEGEKSFYCFFVGFSRINKDFLVWLTFGLYYCSHLWSQGFSFNWIQFSMVFLEDLQFDCL